MSTRVPAWRRVPMTLLVGIPVTMGLLVGLGVGFVTDQSGEPMSTAVISTRPASSVPNERIDLISDLSTALTLPPVLGEVATRQDLDVADLRSGLSFERIDSSSFARLSFASADLDTEARRRVIRSLLNVTAEFIAPQTPSPALEAAQQAEKAATDAYYAALRTNAGDFPADQLARVRARIVAATESNQTAQRQALLKSIPGLVNKTRQFDLLAAARDRASDTLRSLTAAEAEQARGGASALGVSFVDEDDPAAAATESAVASVAVRRGFAAGIATALVLAGFTLAIAAGRGRSGSGDGRGPGPSRPAGAPGAERQPSRTRPKQTSSSTRP